MRKLCFCKACSQTVIICSKLTIKTLEGRSDVFIVNFEHISPCSTVSIVKFEQVNAGWAVLDV